MALADTDTLLDRMGLSAKLSLDFFITFARFEYALIAAGHVRQRDNGSVEADWNCFINSVSKLDDKELKPVLDVGANLLADPPKRLILKDGRPEFEPVGNDRRPIRFLLEGVRRARNNLFHGGKYYTPATPPGRNKSVVTESLNVLLKILEIPGISDVRNAYDALE